MASAGSRQDWVEAPNRWEDARMQPVPSTDDITLALHDLGGHGPTLLLCHATGFCGTLWRPVATRLPEYRSVAPDFRGHGDSPAPADHDFDWQGFADDVLAVVDALGSAGCVAAGHSKGAAALLLAEQRCPGTFAALWCFEPVVFPDAVPSTGANPMADSARRRKPGFPSRQAARQNYASKPPFDAFAVEALEAYLDGGFVEGADGSVRLKCPPEHEARVYEMGSQHDAFAHLGEVACPVAVVRGAVAPGPAMFADAIAHALPAGRLEVHEDLGHFGPQQDPARMAESIRAALSSAPTS
jgi:pimeloyl-ACP methyl ester carboxylesterase